MNRRMSGGLLLLPMLVISASTWAEEFPVYQATRVSQAPVLDGKIDETIWLKAPLLSGFVQNGTHTPSAFRTECRIVYDQQTLYVGVIAHEPDMEHLSIRENPEKIWWSDCIEVFLDPMATRSRYFQYIVNAGAYMDSGYNGDMAADIPADAVAGRMDDAWTLEIRIPFSGLGAAPAMGEKWGMNITRGRVEKTPGEKRENSLWSPTDAGHGSPGRFGYLVFSSSEGMEPPLEQPDLAMTKRLLERIEQEARGEWRWTDADVNFQARNERAQRLIALNSILALYPDTRLLHYIRPAIRDEHILPWTAPSPGEIGGGISLTACRGERESVSLGLFAIGDLNSVRISLSDMKSSDGTVIAAAALDPYHVIPWYQSGSGTIFQSRTILLAELLMKDPALVTVDAKERKNVLAFSGLPRDSDRIKPIDIPAFESRQVWITIHVPADAKSGLYQGHVEVGYSAGSIVTVPVAIRVPEWNLAPSPMIHGLYYGRRIPEMKTPVDEAAFLKVLGEELQDQIDHGCNTVATYVGAGPLPSNDSPVATADYINGIFKSNGVTGTPYFCVVEHVGFQQGDQLPAVTERAKKLDAWARQNGRDGFCFMGRDEAAGDRLTSQRPSWEACRKGGGRIWTACRPSYFDSMGDILDFPVVTGRLMPQLAKKVHEKGYRILSYGNPQTGVELPNVYRRNYGLALRAAGYDGAMDYEYRTMDDKGAWDDFDGEGNYRDHNFAYPALDRPIDTIQFEGWREGIDDVRYAATLAGLLEQLGGSDAAKASRAWLDSLTGFEDLDAMRAEMVQRIDEIHSRAK